MSRRFLATFSAWSAMPPSAAHLVQQDDGDGVGPGRAVIRPGELAIELIGLPLHVGDLLDLQQHLVGLLPREGVLLELGGLFGDAQQAGAGLHDFVHDGQEVPVQHGGDLQTAEGGDHGEVLGLVGDLVHLRQEVCHVLAVDRQEVAGGQGLANLVLDLVGLVLGLGHLVLEFGQLVHFPHRARRARPAAPAPRTRGPSWRAGPWARRATFRIFRRSP